jgi:hypothetical protein
VRRNYGYIYDKINLKSINYVTIKVALWNRTRKYDGYDQKTAAY